MDIPKITRQELAEIMVGKMQDIEKKFGYKNGNYGAGEDAFFNFRSTANRAVIPFLRAKYGIEVSEGDAMFLTLMVYMDKHLTALAKNGLADKEFEDRNEDDIVYSLIAIAMARVATKGGDTD